ncbi:hypothetical protein A3D62_03275 [Candidatus Kaiserbacteria bacterium RIFCSPHIGHO2_02_FULL_49_11]|uniref:Uncharacterized protein n=1 Tax=Candidatus Kaiserbacteria bacterium RIFCSPHIGHO2_02_FULL_49_11 TaxID=1798489 RepID=A0A1F6D0W1_9BACT|nr:MAG: hypothetical protein A3D62_03275 [Candidatus Kaiserbacteria bacterium RIFCSPHIGHO2_02_FULL_49_11]
MLGGAQIIFDRIIAYIIDPIVFLIFALGLMVFLWGVMQFIWKADSEDGREAGKQHMIWGIAGMFIMIAAWGIVRLITRTFGL